MFDLVITLIILCVCMTTGVSTAIRDDREVQNYEANYKDKTAETKYTPSIKVYGSYDGTLTQGEVLLASQLQDHEAMPESYISIANKTYDPKLNTEDNNKNRYEEQITTTYKEQAATNISAIWSIIQNDSDTQGYSYTYDLQKKQFILQQVDKTVEEEID